MKQKLIHLSLFLLVAIMLVGAVSFAGTLTPPGSPSKTMKSLADLYQLINTGSNTPANDFTTPGTVSSTMNSLGDIYDLMTTKIAAIDTTKILTGTSIFGKAGSASGPGLPKTGQTICSDNDGVTIACAGHDGDYQAGLPASGAHFTDNGDSTITDNATGLMWQKCPYGQSGASCATGIYSLAASDYLDAIAICEAQTTAGYTDWKLPNILELVSIVDFEVRNPAIDTTFFPNTQNTYFLTSTSKPTAFQGPNRMWYVNFEEGDINNESKWANDSVRCVRSI